MWSKYTRERIKEQRKRRRQDKIHDHNQCQRLSCSFMTSEAQNFISQEKRVPDRETGLMLYSQWKNKRENQTYFLFRSWVLVSVLCLEPKVRYFGLLRHSLPTLWWIFRIVKYRTSTGSIDSSRTWTRTFSGEEKVKRSRELTGTRRTSD